MWAGSRVSCGRHAKARRSSRQIQFFPLDLAREFVRPRQGRLFSERGHQNGGACGVGRSNRKLQSIAHERSHLLMPRNSVDRWLPPPRWRGRSILFRNGSPLRIFANGPLELKFCSREHFSPRSRYSPQSPRGRSVPPRREWAALFISETWWRSTHSRRVAARVRKARPD
jgi:hypothetical protein